MLERLFRPTSIAVVGASRERRAVGRRILDALIAAPFDGPVHAVNPATDHVGAVPTHASLSDIGRPVDLVVVAVPADAVIDVVKEAAQVGARFVVVVSAGFAEAGAEERQRELASVAEELDLRIVGPNCLGLLSTEPGVDMNASFAPSLPPVGDLGLASQSGALGIAIIELAKRLGLGLSNFISIGNQVDVDVTDVVEFWEHDDRTRVGLLYLESVPDPVRFREVAARVGATMPLVAVKSGNTSEGSRAAGSHTAALAGSDRAVDALLHQAGVIRATSLDDMFGIARVLSSQGVPAGRRAAVVTNSGGPAVLCVDALRHAGFTVDELSADAQERLAAGLPEAAATTNPIDMIASAGPDEYRRTVELVAGLDEVDVVIVIYTPIGLDPDSAILDAIADGCDGARRDGPTVPVLVSLVGGGADGGRNGNGGVATPGGLTTFDFPEELARLLGPIARYHDWTRRPRGRVASFDDQDLDRVASIIETARAERGDGWLTVSEARDVITAAGIPLNQGCVVRSQSVARCVADEIGFPLAVSIASTGIVHKTDDGGVHLDITSYEALDDAFDAVRQLAERKDVPFDGALVAEMASGTEVFVGLERDPKFGPLIGFGLGGMTIEVLEDVSFRVAPITDQDAADQIREIRGWPLLEGYRSSPVADVDALTDTLQRISALAMAVPEIRELDVNPLFADRDGVVATDVRIAVGET